MKIVFRSLTSAGRRHPHAFHFRRTVLAAIWPQEESYEPSQNAEKESMKLQENMNFG